MRMRKVIIRKTGRSGMVYILIPAVLETTAMGLVAALETGLAGQLGSDALAALGLTLQPRLLAAALFAGINVAVSASVKKQESAQTNADLTLIRTIIPAIFILSILISTVLRLCPEKVLILAGGQKARTQYAVLENAVSYLRIFATGFPFMMYAQCVCALLRGLGKGWHALLITAAGGIVQTGVGILKLRNVTERHAADIRFCAVAYMWGAIIAAALSVVALIILFSMYQKKRQHAVPTKAALKSIVPIICWIAMEQIILRIGYIISGRMLFGLGTVVFAANQVCQQFASLMYSIGEGFASGGTALMGYTGSRSGEALKKRYLRLSLIVSGLIGICAWLLAGRIANCFIRSGTANGQEVLEMATWALRVFSLFIPLQCSGLFMNGILRAIGQQKTSALISMVATGIIRPAMMFIALKVTSEKLWIIWLLTSLDLLLRFVLLYRIFRKQKGHTVHVP